MCLISLRCDTVYIHIGMNGPNEIVQSNSENCQQSKPVIFEFAPQTGYGEYSDCTDTKQHIVAVGQKSSNNAGMHIGLIEGIQFSYYGNCQYYVKEQCYFKHYNEDTASTRKALYGFSGSRKHGSLVAIRKCREKESPKFLMEFIVSADKQQDTGEYAYGCETNH